MTKDNYTKRWFRDFWGTMTYELKLIFSDWGVLLIFLVAGLLYPLLYNVVYRNGILNETPIAVVDEADCALSRRYIREVDATRECRTAFRCADMEEAKELMQTRQVSGILYFPADYGEKIARNETASVSIYCDMSSFLYYKNALMAVNHVMLEEMNRIQADDFRRAGFTEQEVSQLTTFIPYEENNPYNRAFSYSIFLISTILLIIIQQTMFYGMALLAGTQREQHASFSNLANRHQKHGIFRLVMGRGAAYWLLYLGISLYILTIVPALFGIPQRGNFWDILVLIFFFVTDCVFFSMTWSTFVTRRESVFILFLFMSPICLFLTGTSWPSTAFPKFWTWFSYLFPTTFGCKAFINMSTAGGGLAVAEEQILALTLQTIIYFLLASWSVYLESWSIWRKQVQKETGKGMEELA